MRPRVRHPPLVADREAEGRVFAYGTLSVPLVMEALCGSRLACWPARLSDHARFRVRGQVYPAVVERAGAATPGLAYEGVDPDALTLLDAFEGARYVRRLRIVHPHAGPGRPAWVYVAAPDADAWITAEPWDPEAFATHHAARYAAACRAFRARHVAG